MRVFAAGKRRRGEIIGLLGLVFAIYGGFVCSQKRMHETSGRLAAALVILEEQVKEGHENGSLQIIDRGIRLFGGSDVRIDEAALTFWDDAIQTQLKGPRQPKETTPANAPD